MKEAIKGFIGTKPSYAQLYPDVDSEDPNESFSEVPYEKGFAFLWNLEDIFMKNSVDNATGKLSMQSFINGWVKSKIN